MEQYNGTIGKAERLNWLQICYKYVTDFYFSFSFIV